MKKLLLVSILLFASTLASCRDDAKQVNLPLQPALSPEETQVIANCYTVQQAAEAFAARNNGAYPVNASVQPNLDGNTLLDLLPGGVHLTNPFTNLSTEPLDGYATQRGETGYSHVTDGQVPVDYVITGHGETDLIIQLTKDGPAN